MSKDVEHDQATVSKEFQKESEEFEEEEILVHVEFDCEVDSGMFNPDHTFKIIGIEEESPLMQVGDKVFQGEWRDVIGTSVFFEEDEAKKKEMIHDDPLFSRKQEKPMKYVCSTRKSLLLSRVFVKPKINQQQSKESDDSGTIGETQVSETGIVEGQETQNESIVSEKNDDQKEVT